MDDFRADLKAHLRQAPPGGFVFTLFALPEEMKPFSRVNPDTWLYRVAYSGTGAANTRRSATDVLNNAYPSAESYRTLLICGFAGGLAAGLTPGTLVIGEDATNSTGEIIKADSRLLAVAESVRVPGLAGMRGTIYTADRVLTQATEKRELGARTGAIAVDMETFAAAQIAQQYGVPWLAVRVVTDGVNDDMPLDFNAFAGSDGNVDKKRVIGATLAQPWKIPALIRLGARSSQAAKNLALFLAAYLQNLPDVNA